MASLGGDLVRSRQTEMQGVRYRAFLVLAVIVCLLLLLLGDLTSIVLLQTPVRLLRRQR